MELKSLGITDVYKRKQLPDSLFLPITVETGAGKAPQCQLIKATAVLVTVQKAKISFASVKTSEVLGKKITKISYFIKNNCIEYIKVCE